MIEKAMSESLEEKLWDRWINTITDESYSDFKNKIMKVSVDVKPLEKEEIIDILENYSSYSINEKEEI